MAAAHFFRRDISENLFLLLCGKTWSNAARRDVVKRAESLKSFCVHRRIRAFSHSHTSRSSEYLITFAQSTQRVSSGFSPFFSLFIFTSSYFISFFLRRKKSLLRQILLSAFSAFGGVAALLLLLVPIGRMTVHFPERVVMELDCRQSGGDNDTLLYTMSRAHPCETKLESEMIAARVESCG